jgi:hypothetical protein
MPNHIAAYTPILGANFRAIGLTVAALVLLGFIAAWIRNIVVSRRELGSEIELAPNRKEYLSDEELEGPKLDRSLSFALVLLTLLALILPDRESRESVDGRHQRVDQIEEREGRIGQRRHT